MNAANAFQDGTDASAEFVIVAIVEALEIDFVEIEPGAQVFEDLRSAIAVGNESGEQACGPCLLEDGYGPFAGDKWLVVSADYNSRALHEGVANQSVGRDIERGRDSIGIAQSLRSNPVLTVAAVEVASQHAEAIGESARMGVEERLLFDGIALQSGGVSPGDVERAAAVEADLAYAGLAFREWDSNGRRRSSERGRCRVFRKERDRPRALCCRECHGGQATENL